MDHPKPYHVLITRLSAIGDCILTLPLAAAIKQAMPEAKISWCVSCAARQLLEICPDVDRVVSVPKRWLRQPSAWKSLRAQLLETPIDCAIDPQSLTKSATIGWLSKAPLRIGFSAPRGRELAPWLNNTRVTAAQSLHVVDAQALLLDPLNVPFHQALPRLNIPDATARWAQQHVIRSVDHRSPVIMNPGAGWPSKQWPAERFAEVASWLKKEHQLPTLVVWAGEQERRDALQIESLSGGAAVVAEDTTLVQLAALLKQGQLFVSGDTGPMHLATAVGTRCLALHGPTRPELSGPYGSLHESIHKFQFDGASNLRRSSDNSPMLLITVDDVCERLDRMIREPRSAAA